MKHRLVVRLAVTLGLVLAVVAVAAGCGGGASFSLVFVSGDPLPRLDIVVTRTGAQAVRVEWSDDPYVETFQVARNGAPLVDQTTVRSLLDSSVLANARYCYQVFGYDFAGHLISASEETCIAL